HPVLTIVCGKCCERQAANGWRDSKPVPLAENRARRTKDGGVVDEPHASFAEQLCRSAGTRDLRLIEQAACDARELLCSRFFTETDGLDAGRDLESLRAAERIVRGSGNRTMDFLQQVHLLGEGGIAERAARGGRTGNPGDLTGEHAPIPTPAHVHIRHLRGEVVFALTHLKCRLHAVIAEHVAKREADAAAQETSAAAAARRQVRLHYAIERQ